MDRLAVPASAEGHARGVRQNERAKVGRAVRHAVVAGPRTRRYLFSLAAVARMPASRPVIIASASVMIRSTSS